MDYDVLVIGGGATGAGCALDAATRGTKIVESVVTLVEIAFAHEKKLQDSKRL